MTGGDSGGARGRLKWWVDLVCGAGLGLLSVLKFSSERSRSEPWLAVAAVAEGALAVLVMSGRSPQVAAMALSTLGIVFCAVVVWTGPSIAAANGCGCFGPYRLSYLGHVLAASAVLGAGACQLSLLTVRRSHPRTRGC